jgi:hypothetical protein
VASERDRDGLARAAPPVRRLGAVVGAGWRLAKPVLRASLEIILALIIVFEEWGWRPLADLLARLARFGPWAKLEYGIARLPPYAALLAFVLPSLLLLPLKFMALLLIANGQLLLASLLFIAAKIGATALIARLFTLTQPALMQIGWFAWGYDTIMPWKEALTERVRASWPWRIGRLWKERLRRLGAAHWRRLTPSLAMTGARLRAGAVGLGRRLRVTAIWLRQQVKRRLAAAL